MKKIKSGANLYGTTQGHYGFLYPDYDNILAVTNDVMEASPLSFVTGDQSVIAVLVKLNFTQVVVFVKKEDIQV
jgi:hypothetical protein